MTLARMDLSGKTRHACGSLLRMPCDNKPKFEAVAHEPFGIDGRSPRAHPGTHRAKGLCPRGRPCRQPPAEHFGSLEYGAPARAARFCQLRTLSRLYPHLLGTTGSATREGAASNFNGVP